MSSQKTIISTLCVAFLLITATWAPAVSALSDSTPYGASDPRVSDSIAAMTVTDTETVTITGTLLNENGSAVTTGSVKATPFGPEPTYSAPLNATGSFSLQVPTGDYRIVYSQYENGTYLRDGLSDVHGLARMPINESVNLGTKTIPAADVFTASVIDSAATPLSGVDIYLSTERDNPSAPVRDLSTNADGELAQDNGEGPVGVEIAEDVLLFGQAIRENWTLENTTIHSPTNEAHATLVLNKQSSISGSVVGLANETVTTGSVGFVHEIQDGWQASSSPVTDGTYGVDNPTNQTRAVVYYQSQWGESTSIVRDGLPDIYTVGMITPQTPTSTYNVSLPKAHVLNVTVVNETGHPVPNAIVRVESWANGGSSYDLQMTTNEDGHLVSENSDMVGVEVTGPVNVTAIMPEYTSPPVTKAINVTDAGIHETIQLTKEDFGPTPTPTPSPDTVAIDGRIVDEDGDPVTKSFVAFSNRSIGSYESTTTDMTGNFSVNITEASAHQLQFIQSSLTASDGWQPLTRDGTADIYSVDQMDTSGDPNLGNVTIPAGHVLEIQVVDENGHPIPDAPVIVEHDTTPALDAGWLLWTNENGYYQSENASTSGIEVTGNISIQVRPPENSTEFVAKYRNLTVRDDRMVTIPLNTTPDRTPPTVNLTGVGKTVESVAPPTERTITTNRSLVLTAAANDTDGNVTDVAFVLNATFTNYRQVIAAHQEPDGTWTASPTLTDLPDDGQYSVSVVALDSAGNLNSSTSPVIVSLDRRAPVLGATVTRLDETTGGVSVTADEPLATDTITARIERPNGTHNSIGLTNQDGQWTGTFNYTDAGQYNVSVTAADHTGNQGTATATAKMAPVTTQNKTVTVFFESSGMFIRFNTTEDINDSFVTITESDDPLAPLAQNMSGASFLNGQLGADLETYLANATIGIPINESKLSAGQTADDFQIHYYNESTGTWESISTQTRTVVLDGVTGEYWTASVDHFSTYGAVAIDDEAPTLIDSSPTDGHEYAAGTTPQLTITYEDTESGVNASAVTVRFDDTDVTADAATQITSEQVTYTAAGLANGTAHQLNVTVVDQAGNQVTDTLNVSIATPASFTISDATVNRTNVTTGESVQVTANVTNTGGTNGTFTGVLLANDTVIAQQDVRVASDATASVRFMHAFTTTGNYTLSLGDGVVDTVSVSSAESTDDSDSSGSDGGADPTPPTSESTSTPEPTSTTESTETTEESPAPEPTEPTPETEAPTSTETTTEPVTDVFNGQPGFGFVVALIALVAVCLLGLRREQ